MKELSEEQESKMMNGECPDCGNSVFLHGPCGGMAENIRCFECGAEFNFSPPFSTERLDRNEPSYYRNAFNLKKELVDAKLLTVVQKPWWKRLLGL